MFAFDGGGPGGRGGGPITVRHSISASVASLVGGPGKPTPTGGPGKAAVGGLNATHALCCVGVNVAAGPATGAGCFFCELTFLFEVFWRYQLVVYARRGYLLEV